MDQAVSQALLVKDSVKKRIFNLNMPKIPSKVKFWKNRSSADLTGYDPNFHETCEEDNDGLYRSGIVSKDNQKQMPTEVFQNSRPQNQNSILRRDAGKNSETNHVTQVVSNLTLPKLPSKAKFWRKRSSADITEYDPTIRAIYLGNVLTGWAKGDGCMDKAMASLWSNYTITDKPNIIMKVRVCPSGLNAITKEHGLTEYWAHRITFCNTDSTHPKVFCWIYRHEGRKMRQELRCHAVLCPSENKAREMAKRLKERVHQALVDFKKEKVWQQNARISWDNSSLLTMPFRKIMLQPESSNYRPPLAKSKSAPKLRVIEEDSEDESYNSVPDFETKKNLTLLDRQDDQIHMSHEELQNLHLQKLAISEDGPDSDTNHNLVVAKNGQITSSYSLSVKDNPHHAKDMSIH